MVRSRCQMGANTSAVSSNDGVVDTIIKSKLWKLLDTSSGALVLVLHIPFYNKCGTCEFDRRCSSLYLSFFVARVYPQPQRPGCLLLDGGLPIIRQCG